MSFDLFGLGTMYTYLIFGGALLLLILLIILIAVLSKRRKPKKTGPDVIVTKGPIYIASAQPPVALNQATAAESNTKMIETSGIQAKTGSQPKASDGTDAKTSADLEAGNDNTKVILDANSASVSETDSKEALKKNKKTKKTGSIDKNETGEKPETGEKAESEKKIEPAQKKFCVNCGSPILDTNVFCANCGNKLK